MQRRKLFLRGLAAQYAALAANIAYSLASIPLALHYLGKEGFGLWSVVIQITTMLQLLDLGMSSGASRILIDEKDHRASGRYADTMVTMGIIRVAIGFVVAAAAWLAGPFAVTLLSIPEHFSGTFPVLLGLQGTVAGATLATFFFSTPLYAHNRQDLLGWSQAGLFIVFYISLLAGFLFGWGLYAMVFSSFCGLLWGSAFAFLASARLGLLPSKGEWRGFNMSSFMRVLHISKDIFLMGVGWQLLSGSPVLIVSRLLGLDAAATWSVCTKPFYILMQFLGRPIDVSFPSLAEMFTRGESGRLKLRIGQLLQLTAGITAIGCCVVAFSAPDFVALWTAGKIHWPLANFLAVALMVGIWSVMRVINGFVGISKAFGAMPYIYFVEAIVFMSLSLLLIPRFGVIALPISAAGCHILLSSMFGLYYIRCGLGFSTWDFTRSMVKSAAASIMLVSCGLFVYKWTDYLPNLEALVARAGSMAVLGAVLVIFVALDGSMRREMFGLLRAKLFRSAQSHG